MQLRRDPSLPTCECLLCEVADLLSNTVARQDPAFTENRLSGIPGGRWGAPEDFMGPAVFLASDASAYVTGETLVVDGVSCFLARATFD
jgi:NAD(P)-dependent dehydrogenase (short-subunit alcohol dehydrogenase family)